MRWTTKCEVYEYVSGDPQYLGYIWEISIPKMGDFFNNHSEIFRKIIEQHSGIMEGKYGFYYGKFRKESDIEEVRKILDDYFESIDKITELYFSEDGIKEKVKDIVNPYLIMDRLME